MEQERLYKDLSWLWPVLSPPEDYIEEAEFLTNIIRDYLEFEPNTMLHLGCGGGHIDMTFKKYFEITGIDKSENMLNLARGLNPDCIYKSGDMREIRLDERFDVCLIYDSVNYMLTKEDLKKVFETAYFHLKPDGLMLTVVEETPDKFVQNKTKTNSRKKKDIELTYIEHWYDPDVNDFTYETTFVYLIRRKSDLSIEVDKHICGMFELDVWEKLMIESGFSQLKETFRHSTFSPGEEYPILIGLKKNG
jgi:SAM-dependent methyltransferase